MIRDARKGDVNGFFVRNVPGCRIGPGLHFWADAGHEARGVSLCGMPSSEMRGFGLIRWLTVGAILLGRCPEDVKRVGGGRWPAGRLHFLGCSK